MRDGVKDMGFNQYITTSGMNKRIDSYEQKKVPMLFPASDARYEGTRHGRIKG